VRALSLAICLFVNTVDATAAERVTCVVAIEALGLRPERVIKTREYLRAEGEAIGATLSFFGKGDQPERACFDNHACVHNAALGLDVDAVVHVQLVRVGGTVQLIARSHRANTGDHFAQATLEASTEGFPRSAELRDLLTAALAGLLTEPEPTPEPAAVTELMAVPTGETPHAAVDPSVERGRAYSGFSWPPVILAASGGALMLTGTVMTASQQSTLNDPLTTGSSKEDAHTVGRIGWGGIGVGAALAITGLVMLGLELLEN